MKGIIVHKGKYGATRQYAEWLGAELKLPVQPADDLTKEKLLLFDYIITGSSVYVGKLLIKKWLKQNSVLLGGKKLFLFIVCGTPESEPAKQQDIIKRNVPASLLDSQNIFFLPGRLVKQKLSWKDALILRLGGWVEKDPVKKKAMLSDIDGVKIENLSNIIESVRKFTSGTAKLSSAEAL
ncbi:MAG: flavodoxin domain-containing protein [Bacteroidota bacterium]|nr:flavodoxin domain-containing protein [Bacteroidota bacterium]MDP4250906.1 flavodoxin domain-containing protein [Bacteroidota bacterium]